MNENDYIAEYVKEKRPEILTSFDFIGWKMARIVSDAITSVVDALKGLSDTELEKLNEDLKEGDGDDVS